MKKVLIAAFLLAAAALFAIPASAAQNNPMTIDASQSYLRVGFDDSITMTVHLTASEELPEIENVPILLNFRTKGEYLVSDKPMIVTNADGEATAVIRLNDSNPPEHMKLPMSAWIEASVMSGDYIKNSIMVSITSTGSIKGYVLDDDGSTITGAKITVTMPDGKTFPEGPYLSNDDTPMGFYQIYNLPVGVGFYTLTATKNGYTGIKQADPGYDDVQYDIPIGNYRETIDIPGLLNNSANSTPTPAPAMPGNSETPTKPTAMTTTILIAIAFITLAYIGIKTYRKMF